MIEEGGSSFVAAAVRASDVAASVRPVDMPVSANDCQTCTIQKRPGRWYAGSTIVVESLATSADSKRPSKTTHNLTMRPPSLLVAKSPSAVTRTTPLKSAVDTDMELSDFRINISGSDIFPCGAGEPGTSESDGVHDRNPHR